MNGEGIIIQHYFNLAYKNIVGTKTHSRLDGLLADRSVTAFHALGRREHGVAHPKLTPHLVDFKALPPLPPLDLYRELQAVTPEELRYLLVDMFEANTYWELGTKRVGAERVGTGEWRVTLDVRARKVVVDEAGVETEVPMDDLVEVGVFAAAGEVGAGEPLYLRMHRVRSGEQRITLTVPGEPARAGIDPRNLLIDVEAGDNLAEVTGGAGPRAAAAESSFPISWRVGGM